MEGEAWCDRECSSSSEEDSHSDWSSGSVKSELDRGSPPIARCLLCPFESDDEDGTCVVLEHMIASHDLQLRQIGQPHWYPKSLNLLPPLSDYTRIALINVLRRKYIDQFSRGTPKDVAYRAVEDFLANLTATADVFTKPEDFLEPALSDDPLLYCGFTGWEDGLEEPSSAPALRPPVEAQDSEAFVAALSKGLDAAASNDAPADFFAEAGGEETQSDEEASDGVSTEGAKKRGGRQFSRVDQAYFAGYSELRIHREMVLDESRTKAYKDFMDKNKDCFRDRVVLDVGCGCGVLSLFAAKAGAKKVVALDASKGIAAVAKRTVRLNGEQSVVQVIDGKLEDVRLFWRDAELTLVVAIPRTESPPPGTIPFQCDVIVSEWMGYCLLYECMAFTVLEARDLYLKPGGLVVPNKALIGAVAANFGRELRKAQKCVNFENLYGLNLSVLDIGDAALFGHLEVRAVEVAKLIGAKRAQSQSFDCDASHVQYITDDVKTHPLCLINMQHITKRQLRALRFPFKVKPPRDQTFTSFVFYFDCFFETPAQQAKAPFPNESVVAFGSVEDETLAKAAARPAEGGILLSTSPLAKETHWKQTVLHFLDGDGKLMDFVFSSDLDNMEGFFSINPDPDPRNCRSIVATLELNPSRHWPRLIRSYPME